MRMILIQSSFINTLLVFCTLLIILLTMLRETTVTEVKSLLKVNSVVLPCLIPAYKEHCFRKSQLPEVQYD